MCALACHSRAHYNRAYPLSGDPFFRRCQQLCSDSGASAFGRHHESADFAIRPGLKVVNDTHIDPGDKAVFSICAEHRVVHGVREQSKSFGDYVDSYRIP